MKSRIQYSHNATLLCLVICMGARCAVGTNHVIDSNGDEQNHLPCRYNNNAQAWTERFKIAWESLMKAYSKEALMQELQSTIVQHFQEAKRKVQWCALAEEFLQENIALLMEKQQSHNEEIKEFFCKLPHDLLQILVLKLEQTQDKGKCIEVFLQTAHDGDKEAFIALNDKLGKTLWLCFIKWIRKSERLASLPKDMQEEINQDMQEEHPTVSACSLNAPTKSYIGLAVRLWQSFAEYTQKLQEMPKED